MSSPLPFEPAFTPPGFIFPTNSDSQYAVLEQKLTKAVQRPAQIVAVSAFVEDLVQLKEMAKRLRIPFQGRLFSPKQQIDQWPEDDILTLELDYLDHMVSNQEAILLLSEPLSN